MLRSIIFVALSLAATTSVFASIPKPMASRSASKLIPERGHELVFTVNYSTKQLKDFPLQMVTKAKLTLAKNTSGLLTAKWKATILDIREEKTVEAEASAICRAPNRKRMECVFSSDEGTAILTANSDGVLITIPVGQGIRFDKKGEEGEGMVWAEMLLGTDIENNHFQLAAKKNR
ncbi:MAG: hypothetical protein H7301_06015 [Cryobacterium sp.]|nr:hypothetical protein [Oligoflexia bacterium]